MSIEVGSTVEGKVTGITKFGAFIELPGGDTGLVHISEIANTYVKDINNFLKLNDMVRVKVINIDDNGKIGLSMKQLKNSSKQKKVHVALSFEDRMTKFMKESGERQQDLRNREVKRRGGKSR
jgi:S1 RNA binding domain protein